MRHANPTALMCRPKCPPAFLNCHFNIGENQQLIDEISLRRHNDIVKAIHSNNRDQWQNPDKAENDRAVSVKQFARAYKMKVYYYKI